MKWLAQVVVAVLAFQLATGMRRKAGTDVWALQNHKETTRLATSAADAPNAAMASSQAETVFTESDEYVRAKQVCNGYVPAAVPTSWHMVPGVWDCKCGNGDVLWGYGPACKPDRSRGFDAKGIWKANGQDTEACKCIHPDTRKASAPEGELPPTNTAPSALTEAKRGARHANAGTGSSFLSVGWQQAFATLWSTYSDKSTAQMLNHQATLGSTIMPLY